MAKKRRGRFNEDAFATGVQMDESLQDLAAVRGDVLDVEHRLTPPGLLDDLLQGAVADVVIRRLAYQVNVMVGARASKLRVAEALAVGRSFKVVP